MVKKISVYHVQFDQINVNAITNASAIFVGNNQAVYWQSKHKNNYGFGSGDNNHLHHNLNIVIDNDVVDSPIHEQTFFKDKEKKGGITNTDVHFDSINANFVSIASSISIGDNEQTAWSAHSKTNQGSGAYTGNTVSYKNLNLVFDEDWIDAPIHVEKKMSGKEI